MCLFLVALGSCGIFLLRREHLMILSINTISLFLVNDAPFVEKVVSVGFNRAENRDLSSSPALRAKCALGCVLLLEREHC